MNSAITPASGVSTNTVGTVRRESRSQGNKKVPKCEEKHEGLFTDAVCAIFRVKPFIVLEAELDREGLMAKRLFEVIDLKTKEEQLEYWVHKDYRAIMRHKHMRRRNNIHGQIKTLMERKFKYVGQWIQK